MAEWRALIDRSFVPLQIDELGGVDFRGHLSHSTVEDVTVFEITATPHVVRRTPRLINQVPGRYYKLSLQLEGPAVLEQDGRRADLSPGDLAIYDTHRPYTLHLPTNSRAMVLMFPHELVELTPEEVGRVTALCFPQDTGLGRVINPFFAQLGRNLDQLRGVDGVRLIHSTLDLLVTLLSTELRRVDGDGQDPNQALLRQVRTYIRAHLDDPTLSPASIASAHYISTRRLHALFSGERETVAAWIRSRRLEHIRRDLGDPLQAQRSVSAIAARWGLTDAAHVSRVFKAEFGESPSTYRDRILHQEAGAPTR
ncbi:helix-turn-helix domain-containing protein [Georgenia thermotolerans]|uniref:Helix-turn-helix domain-containing protein n=1 Tax=Georgenia thermotolerans TaxID=527326 RepID=A0A7J5UU30_9MICO|nr:helix-turn-helix domain-containing protein [Georgenia thermotolerans]